ncbi:hypothetical protein ACFFL1_09740 [Samsonia erythrinae]|uniref:Uncharacterized protein n=1 Tax=Samsonia erythrinae TaxID=160434 RepID=A0A4V2VTG1_9GAMM|nr:hypothetical protein [Samsonia erythrinae]TCV06757.1 hypothetical protein EDC54_1031 [Samsonia erythrinae]
MLEVTKDESGQNTVLITKEQMKGLIKTTLGGNYEGALVLKHDYQPLLGRVGGGEQPIDEVLDVIANTYNVAFSIDGKLFVEQVIVKINEDRTNWMPESDLYNVHEMQSEEDFPSISPVSGVEIMGVAYV